MINRQHIQLSLQSLSLVAGFMVWVLISSLISQITLDIHLSKGEISLVTAIPVILGSLLRIPLGYLTNRFGARLMFMVSFILLLFPVFWISIADSLFDLIAGGFFLGIGGAVFSIGVTSSRNIIRKKSTVSSMGFTVQEISGQPLRHLQRRLSLKPSGGNQLCRCIWFCWLSLPYCTFCSVTGMRRRSKFLLRLKSKPFTEIMCYGF